MCLLATRALRIGRIFHARAFTLLALVSATAVGAGGCDDARCPEGTMDVRGFCVDKLGQEKADSAVTGGQADGATSGTDAESSGAGIGGRTSNSGAGGQGDAGDTTSPSGAGGDTSDNAAGAGGMSSMPGGSGGRPAGGTSGPTGASGAGSAADPPACIDSAEVCDNKDNDCDSRIDELVSEPCGPMPVGICRTGTKTCTAGTWSECVGAVTAGTEVCDAANLDEDCDGTPNKGCDCTFTAPVQCGKSGGICRQGQQTCINGKLSECVGKIDPQIEVCDQARQDEDCDGTANEGCDCYNGQQMECGIDTGACQKGTKTCTNGKWPAGCTNEITATAETCDGVDNDCDGEDDEQSCAPGTRCVAARCVACQTNPECSSATNGCIEGYCDTNAGTCRTRNKADGEECALSGTSQGFCDGGRCVACTSKAQCAQPPTPCQEAYCDAVTGTCKTRRIDDGTHCTPEVDVAGECSAGICRKLCGNGRVDGVEECDIGAHASELGRSYDEFSCDKDTCRRRYVYTPCKVVNTSNSPECSSGYCTANNNGEGYCLPPCVDIDPGIRDFECTPMTGRTGHCSAGGCILSCNTSGAACPVGFRCIRSQSSVITGDFCMP